MRRVWVWVGAILVVGFLLSLPSVALWRPTPSTPLREGLFAVAGLTVLLSSLLLGLGAVLAALALAVRWDLVRLPTGAPAGRAAGVGALFVAAAVVLQVLQGYVDQLGPPALVVGSAAAVLHGVGIALLGVWLLGRLAPPSPRARRR
ncbi:hypothetical protein [uncultured Serinicoccus sp.]|uniref:hypothetical protein n=1 Tax=uncultured Serinicoccus sp. TaxID=735514 RepID=UPI002615F75F|nr:hypothetical protein [uncultured Serinicoccus sp.]